MKEYIRKVQEHLARWGVDAILVENPTDLYYLTRLHLSGKILVTFDNAVLFVDGRFLEVCEKDAPCRTVLAKDLEAVKTFLKKERKLRRIGFDTTTSYKAVKAFQGFCKDLSITPVPLEAPVSEVRAVKTPEEIRLLQHAATLGCKGYEYVVGQLRQGVTEAHLAKQLEIFWLMNGGEGLAFPPIIAFGKNASKPHHTPGMSRLKKEDLVLIDIGVTYRHYQSDMTRVVFFGKPTEKFVHIYDVVLEAQGAALALCKPGATIESLDKAARDVIGKAGFGDLFPHNLGHGVGLDIHEVPSLKPSPRKLEEGMVITIEPGIYLPGKGGVRIEDTIVIAKKGHQRLTHSSKDLMVVV